MGFIALLLTLRHCGSEIWHLLSLRNQFPRQPWGRCARFIPHTFGQSVSYLEQIQ